MKGVYRLSMESIRKGYFFISKFNGKGKGLDTTLPSPQKMTDCRPGAASVVFIELSKNVT